MNKILVIIVSLFALAGCTIKYSFTGASIPPDAKTVFVSDFRNVAPIVNPALANDLTEALKDKDLASLANEIGTGLPTLNDIVKELEKPGRDPRDELPPPLMRSGDVMELKDLTEGMELMGTVRNVIDFGAFVDIGVHEDGLVHISQLADHFVKHPLDVVKVGDVVKVRVLSVDVKKKRISLTMKNVK